jgi:hypothetical protein
MPILLYFFRDFPRGLFNLIREQVDHFFTPRFLPISNVVVLKDLLLYLNHRLFLLRHVYLRYHLILLLIDFVN